MKGEDDRTTTTCSARVFMYVPPQIGISGRCDTLACKRKRVSRQSISVVVETRLEFLCHPSRMLSRDNESGVRDPLRSVKCLPHSRRRRNGYGSKGPRA